VRKADEYFERVPQENLGATKPFSSPEIALDLLPKLQAMLYSAKLYKGARVLDFGAGAGWLSRALATMGLHPTALDVSTTVLRTAKEIAEQRLERKAADRIKYLRHDGLKFAAPNGAFDRVLSFDAFHHVPDQGRILREIHRVLAEDGIASFVEPGPEHSKTQTSQEEMRNHDVIENDIVIEKIWEEAKQAGFSECNLWFYTLAPLALIDEGDLTGSLVAEHVIWFEQNPDNYRYLLRRSKRTA